MSMSGIQLVHGPTMAKANPGRRDAGPAGRRLAGKMSACGAGLGEHSTPRETPRTPLALEPPQGADGA
jgi:hypothetical protein